MAKQISYEEAVVKARRYVHWLVDCPTCGAPSPTIKPDPQEAEWGWCEKGKHRFATYTARKSREGADQIWPEGFPWTPPEGWIPPAQPAGAKKHG
jgi:hypothetical protein